MTRHLFYLIGVLSAALIIAPTAAAKEHMIGDKTVNMVFTDTGLATLATAACKGNTGRIRELVASGVDPNGTGLDGAVPLFWAIHCQNLKGIEALLEAGADPNYRLPGRFNLVWQAATYSKSGILKLVLQYGGNPTTPVYDGYTTAARAMMLALDRGNWTNYYLLLNNGLDINEPEDEIGTTIAVRLASAGQWDKVKELLDRGYSYDLPKIGHFTQYHALTSAQNENRLLVRQWLRDREVPFTLRDEG